MALFSFSHSIRQRILLSSFIVLILFVLSSAFSIQRFASTTDSFGRLQAVGEETTLMLQMSADLAELRLDIMHFINVRHESAFARITDSLSKLESDLESISRTVVDPERVAILEQMQRVYANYAASIHSMQESREAELELREEQIPAMSGRMFMQSIISLRSAEYDGNIDLSNQIRRIQGELLQAEVRMIAYQLHRKSSAQVEAQEFLKLAEHSTSASIAGVPWTEQNRSDLVELKKRIQEYDTLFRRTVQATRGSQFLTNVVMEGEATEFETLTSQLKETTLNLQNSLIETVNAETEEARITTTTVTLGAIMLGVLLSLSLSQSILVPIKEISGVFQKLANGDVQGPIPGLERRDEIGMLAASATVFKNVSARTKVLLGKSEELASELQERETQLELKTRELEKSLEELHNFTYVASHDLKSPLRAIDNLARWVVEDCVGKLPAESEAHLELLQQRICLMETLLDDLLLYSKVGKVEDQLLDISLAELLEEVILLSDIPEGFELQLPQTDIRLKTFAVSLRQVFLNLFSNAFKYGGSDRSVLTVEWSDSDEEFLTFSVADNGSGIEPRYHHKIFEMFQTLSTKEVFGGSGMGLAIVSKVVDSVGGTISIESELGEGAKFIFTWPKDSARYIKT